MAKRLVPFVLILASAGGASAAPVGPLRLPQEAQRPQPSRTAPAPPGDQGARVAPAWLGVSMGKGTDVGVPVEHVVRGSPAQKAGVVAGDRIVEVNGVRVTGPHEVTRAVSSRHVGERVSVAVERRGAPLTLAVVLAARPSGDEILRMDLVGAPAPPWTNVTPLSGAPSSITSLRGRVVIVDFWASWCGPCRLLAPRLSALGDRLGAQGLSVVGITTDEAERAATFAEAHRMRYGIVVDKDGDTSRAYGITGLPTMLIVDRRGVVRDVTVGFDPSGEAQLEATLRALLAEPVAGAASAPAASAPQLNPLPSPSPSSPSPSTPPPPPVVAPRVPTVPRPPGR